MMNQDQQTLQEELKRLKAKRNKVRPGTDDDRELKAQIQKIERELQRRAAFPSPPPPKPARDAYLRRVLSISSRLELSGIDRKATDTDADACLNLDAVYTALLTLSSDQEMRAMDREQEERNRRLSALDLVNRHERLVLLGDPGSGKSTFVKVCGDVSGRSLAGPISRQFPAPDRAAAG